MTSNPERSESRNPAIDRDLALFCEHGDADALGRVFDATAPQLALVAAHVVPGDAHAVEDLIHTTFLEVIRSRERFEPGRPAFPWLIAILGRRAVDLRRRTKLRRAMPVGEAAVLEVTDHTDPATIAASRELVECLTRAVGEIRPPYREVLSLRIVHALTPAEIARALGRPVGTVHSQLHRGLEKLQMRLPSGIAAGALACFSPSDFTASLRANILRAVPCPARSPAQDGSTASRVSSGPRSIGSTAGKSWIALAAVAAVSVCAFAFGWGWDDSVAPVAVDRNGAAGIDAMNSSGLDDSDHAEQRSSVEAGGSTAGSTAGFADAFVKLTGHVVRHEDRSALAGAEITAGLFGRVPVDGLPAAEVSAMSSADGAFELVFDPRGVERVEAWIRSADRVPMYAQWNGRLKMGVEIGTGVTPLAIGSHLEVAVVDHEGRSVPGYELSIRGASSSSDHPRLTSDSGTFADASVPTIVSGADGIARSGGPILPGVWLRGLGKPRSVGGFPCEFEMPSQPGVVRKTIRLAAPTYPKCAVRGSVVDDRGRAVSFATIVARSRATERRLAARVCANGAFTIGGECEDAIDSIEVLEVRSTLHRGYRYRVDGVATFRAGDRDVKLIVQRRRLRTVRLRVTERSSRRPVERVDVVARGFRERGATLLLEPLALWRPALSESQRDPGHFVLESLPTHHAIRLLVRASGRSDLEPIVVRDIAVDGPGDEVVEVQLWPAVERRVMVVDREGRAVAGSEVEFFTGLWRAASEGCPVDAFAGVSVNIAPRVLLCRSRTDANGEAKLRTGSDVGGCMVRVTGSSHSEQFAAFGAGSAGTSPLRIVVDRAGQISVRLTPMGDVAAIGPDSGARHAASILEDPESYLGRFRCRATLVMESDRRRDSRALVDDAGRFTFEAVPTGLPFSIELAFPDRLGNARFGPFDGLVDGGEHRELTLDLAARPAHIVRGRIAVESSAASLSELELRIAPRMFRTPLSVQGEFTVERRPGRYRATLRDEDGNTRLAELVVPAAPSQGVLVLRFD